MPARQGASPSQPGVGALVLLVLPCSKLACVPASSRLSFKQVLVAFALKYSCAFVIELEVLTCLKHRRKCSGQRSRAGTISICEDLIVSAGGKKHSVGCRHV